MIYISLLSHNATEYVKSSSLLAEGEMGLCRSFIQNTTTNYTKDMKLTLHRTFSTSYSKLYDSAPKSLTIKYITVKKIH